MESRGRKLFKRWNRAAVGIRGGELLVEASGEYKVSVGRRTKGAGHYFQLKI